MGAVPIDESLQQARVGDLLHERGQVGRGGIVREPELQQAAIEKVRADKVREATDGCDGTWVAHPGLVGVAKAVFDQYMPTPNQLHRRRNDVTVTAADLLKFQPEKPITEAGLRNNISVGIQYIGAWLAGNGCVPVFNLMEDAATAEISRAQVWQWIRHKAKFSDDGRPIDVKLCRKILNEEMDKVARGEDPLGLVRDRAVNEPMISLRREKAALQFLQEAPGATAVQAVNDLVAIGAANLLLNQGQRIPQDISIVGFGNILVAEYFRVGLPVPSHLLEVVAVVLVVLVWLQRL